MSLQMAILKVLISYPHGRATVAEMKSDLALLGTCGQDWSNRMRRLSALVPGLDIFGQAYVVRDDEGWQITPEGRKFLHLLEAGEMPSIGGAPALLAEARSSVQQPQLMLIGPKRRRRKGWRGTRGARSRR